MSVVENLNESVKGKPQVAGIFSTFLNDILTKTDLLDMLLPLCYHGGIGRDIIIGEQAPPPTPPRLHGENDDPDQLKICALCGAPTEAIICAADGSELCPGCAAKHRGRL
jgi:hypothetical protein